MSNPDNQSQTLRLGTRGSELALWQAHYIKRALEALGSAVSLVIITTKGDAIQHLSFDKMEGKGFFTKEIEEALLDGRIDLAVHSCKDLSTEDVPGLTLSAFSYRENPADVLIINPNAYEPLNPIGLKQGAMVGTSAARRQAQLADLRPDLRFTAIRGNVPTRVGKVRSGEVDAAVLAAAGLERLGLDLSEFKVVELQPWQMVPSAAQGVMAIQTRNEDHSTIKWVSQLDNSAVREIVSAERELLGRFNGGCQLPLGIYIHPDKHATDAWIGYAAYSSKDKSQLLRATVLCKNPTEATEALWEALHLEANSQIDALLTRNHFDPLHQRWLAHAGINLDLIDAVEESILPKTYDNPPTDWVFFSSPSGVHAFFENHQLREGVLVGAMGSGTTDALKAQGIEPDFQGQSDVTVVTDAFAEIVGKKTVLFPTYEGGLERAQTSVTKSGGTAINFLVGTKKSRKVELHKPHYHLGIFTASSQVISFAKQGHLAKIAHFIAIGESTSSTLTNHGISQDQITISPIPNLAMLTQLACGFAPRFKTPNNN